MKRNFGTQGEDNTNQSGHSGYTTANRITENPRKTTHARRYSNEELRRWGIPTPEEEALISDPHTFLDIAPYRRFITAPISALKDLYRSTARGMILNAVKKGKTAEPGKWVDVARGPNGLEHQSKMSGRPITKIDGKLYIKEYELNGVKFDDYKDGMLYEYKGPQGNLINKKTGEFYDCILSGWGFRDDALRQVRAAQGIPVVWRVGADQVDAFKKAVGRVPGMIIVP